MNPALARQACAGVNPAAGAWIAPRVTAGAARRASLAGALMLLALAALLGEASSARSAPLVQQGSKLEGAGEIGGGQFGDSVALSSDGNTALIGAPADNGHAGAVWVFTRSGSTWSQQGPKLLGGGEVAGCCGGEFGDSVALSADGNTALIGGVNDEGAAGAAWVFTRSGSTWSQQDEKLTAALGEVIPEGGLGSSVALSADGNTALIGAAGHGLGGAAWVFTRSGSSWTQQGARLSAASEEESEDFGRSAALSADGNTALIGGLNSTYGAAWVFTRSGASWAQQGERLKGGKEEIGTGRFGWSVALSSDGNTALIGAYSDKTSVAPESGEPAPQVGSAWLFSRSGASWAEQPPKLSAPTSEESVGEGRFGYSVALSADASTALIGGPGNAGIGAAWVFASPTPPPAAVPAPSPPPAAAPASPPTPPSLTNVAQSHKSWREGKAQAVLASKRKLPPIGTVFSFTLNEQASASFAFTQPAAGRKVNGKCVAQTQKNRRDATCKRTVTDGTLSFAGHSGANRVSFQGLLSRTKKLKPGGYTLVISATNSAHQTATSHGLAFTIVK